MARLPLPRFGANRFLWLGLAAAATVVLLLVGSSIVKQARVSDKTIHAEFAQAAGLRPGATVDVSGIEVGAVRAVRLAGDKVVVDLRVRRDLRLGANARAAIKMSTILGRLHVELVPGDGNGLPGDTIPLENTSVPYNLGKVIQDTQYKSSFERIERIDPAIGNAVAQRQQLLKQLLDNVAALSALLQEMGIENNGQLGPLIHDLNTMTEGLQKNKENLDRLYEVMPVAVRQFNNALGNGPYGEVWAPWVLPDNWLCFAQAIPGCN
ncbi:MlaD family protein [Nocardia farcinica]|uniref:MlaD family protein n=1 Tax=Nocardia farcinica TaxID=37329 RepID=UPI002458309E|nr:MlaD family protein [Nocardia farcinica]